MPDLDNDLPQDPCRPDAGTSEPLPHEGTVHGTRFTGLGSAWVKMPYGLPIFAGSPVVGLMGDIGSGKDSVADELVRSFGFHKLSLAEPLKNLVLDIFGLDSHHVFGTQVDKAEVLDGRDGRPMIAGHQILGTDTGECHTQDGDVVEAYRTPREILQFVGTECFRAIDPNVWVKKLEREIVMARRAFPQAKNRVVIADVRFPNEAEMVRRLGGVLICTSILDQSGKVIDQRLGADNHESEQAWRKVQVDARLAAQHGDLQGLFRETGHLMEALGL